ncbi:hypothetical protein GGH12_006010 [Coemansia sp. RSA 1822]|nr:hypothetical protein LPJ76_005493 [Coemansia sp. RSA 638]KAJ2542622.1 hypothetical protein GGF49_002710 [Coemansia sp. RSA 1853]KAJ2558054.1 hypothetical protein GGH12_006010 [Coemansia sp. RSA 1822]
MGPRKGTTRKGAVAKKTGPTRTRSERNNDSTSDVASTEEEQVKQTPHAVRQTNRAAHGALMSEHRTRQILTPVFGRKYARGTVDIPQTPRNMDAMRVAVSRTPYTAKRAISEYEAERDPIKTYVRLKPADPSLFAGTLPKSLLQVVSDKEVEIARGVSEEEVCERYLFAGVLPTLAKQPRVFEVCAMPVVRDLFSGFNTLLFTYGITNSGKTHTVQGGGGNAGLLPRSVKAILEAMEASGVQGEFPVRPKYATQVEYSSDPRVVAPTFRSAPGEEAWLAGLDYDTDGVAEIAQTLQADGEWVYQLYVSYFEVYNEMVYDLLDLTTLTTVQVKSPDDDAQGQSTRGRTGRKRGARGRKRDDPDDPLRMSPTAIAGLARTALVLRSEGGRGNEAFVDGVTEVRVRTVQDLVRVLIHGQLRRSVHATGLNSGSSRSHALFQAKLVKLRRDAPIVPLSSVPSSAQASVRTMTIVDLAGSERAKRTLNQGDRLAEAGKINVSLMTLKKCLDVRRFNAALDPNDAGTQLVPYNESKVTRLFQPALEGGAKTVMVVCIDPYEHVLDTEPNKGASSSHALAETKNVLDFARVASSLVAKVRRVYDPPVMPIESPTHGAPMQGADVLVDSDDEIFFDTAVERTGQKRAGSVHGVDKGVQTDDALVMSAKRQRRDLGGDWKHPTPRAAPNKQAITAVPADRRPQTPRTEATGEWGQMTHGSAFSFEASAPEAGLQLTQGLAQGGEHEVQRLRAALSDAQARLSAEQRGRAQEVNELAEYAEALDAAVTDLRAKYMAAQERALNIEETTRAEAAAFFIDKIAQVQAQAGDRLQDELQVSEQKAAHKLDILARLRQLRDSDSDDELDAAQVPTVSPRTAVRRAVSRAASKKANKYASVSAGESRELANTRLRVESLAAQVTSQSTQLEMVAQARTADRARNETLENALVEANGRASSLEARLLRLTSAHSPAAELAITQAHERERAEFLAQITMLKQQLRAAETHSMRARRQWETNELLPVQERMRAMMSDSTCEPRANDDTSCMDVSEALARAERDRDNAWAWWTREQERTSQVCAQNDVLMREIRVLRARMQAAEPASPRASEQAAREDSDRMSDSDESFCKVSLHEATSLAAINGGNPLGASAMSPSQSSMGLKSNALDRVISKGGRVLHRNTNAKAFAAARESTESTTPSIMSPTREGRAKRVVSRVFNLTPGSRRPDGSRPYMAGRFAHTDTAVGSYSAEVFSYQNGGRTRGDTLESEDMDSRQAKVRSIVYSGPIVAHKTGGVSVTFTSQEVNDLPLGEEPILEQSEEDQVADEDVREGTESEVMSDAGSAYGSDSAETEPRPELMEIPSMASLQSTVKKKRKLHTARTVLDVGSPENDADDRMVGAPDMRVPLGQANSRVSMAIEPQESKNPVLFTPVRTRSRARPNELMDDEHARDKDSIFTTPMKMLSRLRNRKK